MTHRSKLALAVPTPTRTIGRAEGELESIPEQEWQLLQTRAAVLRSFGEGSMTHAQAKRAAKQLGVHWTTAYRWRKRLLEGELITALQDRTRGFPMRQGRLSAAQEEVVAQVVKSRLGRTAGVRSVDLVEEVRRRCGRAGLVTPSRRAIDLRWKRALAAASASAPLPGSLHAAEPLDIVQIDHTVSDVMVVDDLYRQPIGRPYLTLALDVATRSVLAALLSFDPPGAATVALCLARAARSKNDWLASLGLSGDWPMAGLPRCLHLDNAPEFHSKALIRGCAQFGIELVWRPVGRPHFGGHIERSIGTLMSRFKSLPGATGSNTVERRDRRPEKTATMTLGDLERWLAVEIGQRYHHRPHKGLQGATPHTAWMARPPTALSPARQEALPWAFLPAVSRSVRRDGLHFQNIRYWHPVFAQWAVAGVAVVAHYDPRDLSQLYVRAEGETMLAVHYAGLHRPAVSLWESVAAARHLRQLGETKVREARLFAAIEQQRQIVRRAASKTRSARAKQQRRVQHQQIADEARQQAPPPGAPTSASSDQETGEYPGEVW